MGLKHPDYDGIICGVYQGHGKQSPSDNFSGAIKFIIANVKYYTKYVKSTLPTNSKITSSNSSISIAIQLAIGWGNESIVAIFRGAEA